MLKKIYQYFKIFYFINLFYILKNFPTLEKTLYTKTLYYQKSDFFVRILDLKKDKYFLDPIILPFLKIRKDIFTIFLEQVPPNDYFTIKTDFPLNALKLYFHTFFFKYFYYRHQNQILDIFLEKFRGHKSRPISLL